MSIAIDEETQELADIEVGRGPEDSTEYWYNPQKGNEMQSHGTYQALVEHGADLVETGGAQLHDLQLRNWDSYQDDEDPTTAQMIGGNVPPEKIIADVKVILKRRKVETQANDEPKPNQGSHVKWQNLWEDIDIPKRPQSHTQLSLLVEASSHTSITENGSNAVDEALETGRIVEVKNGKYIPEGWA